MKEKKTKLSKAMIRTIIVVAVIAATVTALLIANLFLPVKYISAYFVFSREALPEYSARVTFADVGYGDCILAEFPDGEVVLIDGGDGSYSHELKLLTLLNRRGIQKIDYLVCTSVKPEHCGGLAEILRYKTVGKVFAPYCVATRINEEYRRFQEEAEKFDEEICEYGVGASGVGWAFSFLSPTVHTLEEEGSEYFDMNENPTTERINRASAVMWLECLGVNFLLSSDMTATVADKLVAAYLVDGLKDANDEPVRLEECDFMTVALHGAEEGAYARLWEITSPSAAVVSVGENGRGAPSLAAIADAQRFVGEELYRTDETGTLTVTISDGTYFIGKEKS